jgi:uncharacterized repeat protein (TIGR02543 family)
LIYTITENDKTYIIDLSDELLDDEIVYIPSSVRNFYNGEPMPLVLSGNMWYGGSISSDALRILYVTGGQTGFEDGWYDNIDYLEMVVFNTLSPTYFPLSVPHTTLQDILQYGFFMMCAHEAYENVVQYYDSKWDNEFGSNDWESPVWVLSSRASFYFNYDNSYNEGLYRIGMEYEIGIDLTPPEGPTREGYQFIGWSSDATTFIPYDFATSENDVDVQLYAHWE